MRKTTPGASLRRKRRPKQLLVSYAMLLPFLFFFFLMFVMPIFVSLFMSFTNFNMLQTPDFVGFSNYIKLFLDDDVFVTALTNTMVFAFISGPISYVLCFLLAWIISDLGPTLRSIVTVCFYAPSVAGTGIYVVWRLIFSSDSYGMINGLLMRMGLIDEPILWLTDPQMSLGIVILVHIWLSLGAGFLAFIAGLQNIDRSQYEAGAIDGVRNRWQELWHITLPQMVPQLLIGAVLSISSAFAVGYQNALLTGNPSTDYSTHTVLLHMTDYGYTRFEMGYACAVAVVLFVLMVGTWLVINRGLRRMSSE